MPNRGRRIFINVRHLAIAIVTIRERPVTVNRASSQRHYQLRHRLVGAVIMVGAAVVAIPWLLALPQNNAHDAAHDAVDAHAAKKNLRFGITPKPIAPTSDKSAAAKKSGKSNTIQKPTALTAARTAAAQSKTPTKSTAKPALKSAPATPALLPANAKSANAKSGVGQKPPPTATDGWAVRVGTYSKQANADAVAKKLSASGFSVRKTIVKTALGGNATRIWLGPYAQKDTAREVSRGLKSITGEIGFVIKHSPAN